MRLNRMVTALVAVGLATAGLVSAGGAAVADTSSFTVYDNTHYPDATIGHGAVVTDFVPNWVCKQLFTQAGGMPSEADWKDAVSTYNVHSTGPLVLDCENQYLTGTASTAAAHYQHLLQLQAWAREVEPNKPIGWYGLLGNTSSAYFSYYRDLIAADANTAFFPSAYTYSANGQTWLNSLKAKLPAAAQIDPAVPVLPYVWPQYHEGSSPSTLSLTYIPAAQWEVELATIKELGLAGVVIWSGTQAGAAGQGWVPATQSFLDGLAGPVQTDLAQGRAVTASSSYSAGYPAPFAVDGDPSTRWASAYADPQWIQVDLGTTRHITGARLMWGGYATAYTLQVSSDATNWTDLYATTSGDGGIDRLTGLNGSGRYVRVLGTTRSSANAYSLWDFNVYGS